MKDILHPNQIKQHQKFDTEITPAELNLIQTWNHAIDSGEDPRQIRKHNPSGLTHVMMAYSKHLQHYPHISMLEKSQYLKFWGFTEENTAEILGHTYLTYHKQMLALGKRFRVLGGTNIDLNLHETQTKEKVDQLFSSTKDINKIVLDMRDLGYSHDEIHNFLGIEQRQIQQIAPLHSKLKIEADLNKTTENSNYRNIHNHSKIKKNGHFSWKGQAYYVGTKYWNSTVYIKENEPNHVLEIYADPQMKILTRTVPMKPKKP
jgi:hypothetical protein